MKKIIIVFILAVFITTSCKKSELQILNPNSPQPVIAYPSQGGLEEVALGVWTKMNTGNNLLMHSLVAHSIMGDEQWASVGNFGWRYANQVNTITLPAAQGGIVVPNIFNTTQQAQLQSLNNLVSANANATDVFVYEWNLGYLLNGEANDLLQAISVNSVVSASEKTVLQAFAYFWKGLAYSRLGSMYISGVINNNIDGTTSPLYLPHSALITEANANFDKAIALLAPYANTDAVYTSTMKVINPPFCTYPTNAAMWIREMYTYEARNYMVNKKVTVMTATDWTAVQTLAAKGLISTDVTFAEGMDPAGTNDFSGTQGHVFLWDNYTGNPGWTYMSERLVQDFKAGDARFTKGVTAIKTPEVNRSSRGIQFGTRYVASLIENGGYWSTNAKHLGYEQFAGSYEENALMLAEASIRTGAIDAGLAYVDQVRTFQGAGLAAVANTGLSSAAAIEELRKERRIGLYLRGLAFYDARRWGVTAPASAGGGRANCIVLVPNSVFTTPTASGYTPLSCFIDYNYMDYWDVPATEFSYNPPAAGSAAIAN